MAYTSRSGYAQEQHQHSRSDDEINLGRLHQAWKSLCRDWEVGDEQLAEILINCHTVVKDCRSCSAKMLLHRSISNAVLPAMACDQDSDASSEGVCSEKSASDGNQVGSSSSQSPTAEVDTQHGSCGIVGPTTRKCAIDADQAGKESCSVDSREKCNSGSVSRSSDACEESADVRGATEGETGAERERSRQISQIPCYFSDAKPVAKIVNDCGDPEIKSSAGLDSMARDLSVKNAARNGSSDDGKVAAAMREDSGPGETEEEVQDESAWEDYNEFFVDSNDDPNDKDYVENQESEDPDYEPDASSKVRRSKRAIRPYKKRVRDEASGSTVVPKKARKTKSAKKAVKEKKGKVRKKAVHVEKSKAQKKPKPIQHYVLNDGKNSRCHIKYQPYLEVVYLEGDSKDLLSNSFTDSEMMGDFMKRIIKPDDLSQGDSATCLGESSMPDTNVPPAFNNSRTLVYRCGECKLVSKCLKNLQKHILHVELADAELVACQYCGKRICRTAINSHEKRHEKGWEARKSEHRCPYAGCSYVNKNQSRLTRHVWAVHENRRSFGCEWDGCGKRFNTPYSLKVHMRIHTGDKPIVCYLCGYQCRQKASLNWHMKTKHPEASMAKSVMSASF